MVSICCKISTIISIFVLFISFVSSVQSVNVNNTNRSSVQPRVESEKLKHIRDYLKKINKSALKTIQSPDGDLIDCVLSHEQPAFDHPLLKGQKPLVAPPEMPKGPTSVNDSIKENLQVWRMSGESCPENTVPIRRITEEDVLRASSVRTFGRKLIEYNNHEHAIVYVEGRYYGASATMDVWAPKVEGETEFSLSQIWVIAGSMENGDRNTIEAGWHSDAYRHTGCYNLRCRGFVQVSSKIVPGAAIGATQYGGKLYDLPFCIYKDSSSGNWWLKVNNIRVGYWPSKIFTHLQHGPADMIHLGGEILNNRSSGTHTKTQMGSGQFPNEGYGKAAFFKQVQVYSWMNGQNPVNPLQLKSFFERPKCYWTGFGKERKTKTLGYFFAYGGPGGAAQGCT